MHRITMKCPIVTLSSIHQKFRRRWTGQGQGISKLFTEKELISWKSNQNKQKSPQSHQQQQNKSECTKCLRSSSLEVEFETRIWFVEFIRGVRFKENLSQRLKSKRDQGKELSKCVVSDGVWPQPDLRGGSGALAASQARRSTFLSSCVSHCLWV